jgi:hypothetical protein
MEELPAGYMAGFSLAWSAKDFSHKWTGIVQKAFRSSRKYWPHYHTKLGQK